jgi:hypothetical protein
MISFFLPFLFKSISDRRPTAEQRLSVLFALYALNIGPAVQGVVKVRYLAYNERKRLDGHVQKIRSILIVRIKIC